MRLGFYNLFFVLAKNLTEIVTYRRRLVGDFSLLELEFTLHATLCRDTMTKRVLLTKGSSLVLQVETSYLHATILVFPNQAAEKSHHDHS